MASSHTITYGWASGNETISKSASFSGSGRNDIVDESIANGQTDKAVTYTCDVSAVKSFFMVSDAAVTVETNSGSSPANTITLVADVPYVWNTSSHDTFKLTTDVTGLFVTNASGSTATLNIRCVQDATP